jgi:3-phenylpropionate/cinnamic acid dioxygenase small subunit
MEALDQRSAAMTVGTERVPIGSAEYSAVVEWLYAEAKALDCGDFRGWLGLLAEDIDYTMPTRQSVYPKDGEGFAMGFGFFVENYSSLETRVRRLETDQAWAEQPGSRTRHFVSNILVTRLEHDMFLATSAFMITRIRSDLPYDFFTGERQDVLRRAGDGFRLAKRTVLIDQTVLKSYNLSIFF